MRLRNADAILLEVADLGEADRLLVFLSAAHGKKRGAAKGAKRKHSRFAGQLQPLARARVSWAEKDDRELVRVGSVELQRPCKVLFADLEGILLSACLAEQAATFAPEGEDSALLYRLLDSTLDALAAGVDRGLAARYFEAWVLRLAGIFPLPRECPQCGRPLAAAAARDGGGRIEAVAAALPASGQGMLCTACAGRDPGRLEVPVDALDLLLRIGRESLPRLAARPPDPHTLSLIEEVCARVRRSFLDGELKSYRVMQDTLAALGG